MTKEQFEKLELEATKKAEEDSCAQMYQDIHNEFISIWNEIFDFCYENDLEPDIVIQILVKQLSSTRQKQIKKDGYISKIYKVRGEE